MKSFLPNTSHNHQQMVGDLRLKAQRAMTRPTSQQTAAASAKGKEVDALYDDAFAAVEASLAPAGLAQPHIVTVGQHVAQRTKHSTLESAWGRATTTDMLSSPLVSPPASDERPSQIPEDSLMRSVLETAPHVKLDESRLPFSQAVDDTLQDMHKSHRFGVLYIAQRLYNPKRMRRERFVQLLAAIAQVQVQERFALIALCEPILEEMEFLQSDSLSRYIFDILGATSESRPLAADTATSQARTEAFLAHWNMHENLSALSSRDQNAFISVPTFEQMQDMRAQALLKAALCDTNEEEIHLQSGRMRKKL